MISVNMLSWLGSRCWISTNAIPVSVGRVWKNCLYARPPAEAPIATTRKESFAHWHLCAWGPFSGWMRVWIDGISSSLLCLLLLQRLAALEVLNAKPGSNQWHQSIVQRSKRQQCQRSPPSHHLQHRPRSRDAHLRGGRIRVRSFGIPNSAISGTLNCLVSEVAASRGTRSSSRTCQHCQTA